MAKGTLAKKPPAKKLGKTRWKTRFDPRQPKFLDYWLDVKSPTHGNALQSALRAGFSREYAETLLSQHPAWLEKARSEFDFVDRVEKHFEDVLNLPIKKQVMGAFGPVFSGKGKNRKPVFDFHIPTIKEKTEVAEFIAQTLGKKKYGTKESKQLPPLQTLIIINAPAGTNGETNRVHTVPETVGSATVIGRQSNE